MVGCIPKFGVFKIMFNYFVQSLLVVAVCKCPQNTWQQHFQTAVVFLILAVLRKRALVEF